MLYMSTTLSDKSQEGFSPRDATLEALMRFKHEWTLDELLEAVQSTGFSVHTRHPYGDIKRQGGANLYLTKSDT